VTFAEGTHNQLLIAYTLPNQGNIAA
jgi:hypothetical protein